MDWKEFISSVVGSLAWPAAIAFIVYLLRQPIGRIIENLRKASWKGAALEFGRSLDRAESAARQARIAVTPSSSSSSNWESDSAAGWGRSASLAEGSPRAAVIEAWLRLEREILELGRASGVDPTERRWTTQAVVRELQEKGVIDPSVAEVIESLRRARNVAVHEENYTVSPNDAAEYVELSARVAATLRDARIERLAGT